MIIPVHIDMSDLVEEFNLSEDQSTSLGSSIIDKIVEEYDNRWTNQINANLKQTKKDYNRGRFMERTSPLEVVFGLRNIDNPIPMMIEEGKNPFDMKVGFANSDKVKFNKKGGWYLTIPFRHATSQAVAESGIFASVMPKSIYNQVSQTGKIGTPPSPFDKLGSRASIDRMGVKKPEYIHQNPVYQNLVKVNIASTPEEKRSAYMTFRRVGANSDENSWWNKGILPYDLMGKALKDADVNTVAQMAIDKFLQTL